MIRFLVILLVWVCTLGVLDIDIRFRDGLHIHFKSWLMWLTGKYKKLPRPPERSIIDAVEESDLDEVNTLLDPRKTSSVPFNEQAYKHLLSTEVKPPKE